jgi:peptidyl-prolyl cis-trans isomerase B (cyclophilin B)
MRVPHLAAVATAALLLGCSLPAQQPRDVEPRGKPAGTAKGGKVEAPKDDAKTAKDPVIVALDKFRKAKVSTKSADWRTRLPAPPKQAFDPARQYRWHLETSVGPLVVTLLPEAAPMHVTSVIHLARCGFYDGLSFPRVVKGFMAQGGSPTNDTAGDAGYRMDGELASGQKHDKPGALSAANSGPGTDGSQFFLTFVATPHLDGKHTVHGFVTEGLETLQAIEARGSDKDGEPVKEKVTIVRTWITVVDAPAAPAAPARDTKPPAGGQ